MGETTADALRTLLHPRSVAIIGASADPNAPSGLPVGILQEQGFAGPIYIVNPSRDTVQGLPSYKDVGSIDDEIDLALVCVQSRLVPGVLDECGRKGVRTAYVLTSGFEMGGDGRELDAELRQVLQRWPLRLAGPNGIGIVNLHDRVALTMSPVSGPGRQLQPGNVAVIAQSGGLGFGIAQYAVARGLGLSYIVSTGNEVDLELADFLEYFLDDPRTTVVVLFVEGFRTPGRIAELLPRYLERGKALVVAKMGTSEEGQLASVSHTAHAAGDNALYSALFERFGAYHATDVTDLLDATAAFSCWNSVGGRGVGVVTTSGGAGVWMADACVSAGLQLPRLAPESQEEILATLTSYASARNPVDVTASGSRDGGFEKAVASVAASPDVNALVLVGWKPPTGTDAAGIDGKGGSSACDLLGTGDKPVFAYTHHPPNPDWLETYVRAGIPCYMSPAGVATGIKALADYSDAAAALRSHRADEPSLPAAGLPVRSEDTAVLCEYEVKEWLASAGFPVVPGRFVGEVDDAVAAADTLGYPVALKIQDPELPHKWSAGGVVLDVASSASLRAAYASIDTATRRVLSGRKARGVLVEQMTTAGVEMMIGLKTDPDLGAFLLLGAGGTLTEVLSDKVIVPVPVTEADARRVLRRLRCWPLLDGTHGHPSADVDAFCRLVTQVSALGERLVGVIGEMDLNPVIVQRPGAGVVIVDGLAVWDEGVGASSPRTLDVAATGAST